MQAGQTAAGSRGSGSHSLAAGCWCCTRHRSFDGRGQVSLHELEAQNIVPAKRRVAPVEISQAHLGTALQI